LVYCTLKEIVIYPEFSSLLFHSLKIRQSSGQISYASRPTGLPNSGLLWRSSELFKVATSVVASGRVSSESALCIMYCATTPYPTKGYRFYLSL
jgi:hypothetical protein